MAIVLHTQMPHNLSLIIAGKPLPEEGWCLILWECSEDIEQFCVHTQNTQRTSGQLSCFQFQPSFTKDLIQRSQSMVKTICCPQTSYYTFRLVWLPGGTGLSSAGVVQAVSLWAANSHVSPRPLPLERRAWAQEDQQDAAAPRGSPAQSDLQPEEHCSARCKKYMNKVTCTRSWKS